MTTNTDREELHTKVTDLNDLLFNTYSDIKHSYKVLYMDGDDGHSDDVRYALSLEYLSMSYHSYLEFKREYRQSELTFYHINPFFKQYEHYKRQLKEVITDKNSVTKELELAFDKFIAAYGSLNTYISNWIKAYFHWTERI